MAILDSIRQRLRRASGPASGTTATTTTTSARKTWLGAPRWATALVALAIFAVLYWGVLGWIVHDTSADLTLRPAPEAYPPGGSATVAYAATIIDHEVDRGGFTPNDTFLAPTAGLNEMPAFQEGVIALVSRAVAAYSEAVNAELLADAASDLAVEPTRGFFHGNFPFMGGSAGAHYRDAADALIAYNNTLATDQSVRPQGPAVPLAMVEALEAELAESSRLLDAHIRGGEAEVPAELVYQRVRGEAYVAALLLRGLRSEFEPVLRERQLGAAIIEATEQLDEIAETEPIFINAGDLTSQGYFLASAQNALGRLAAGLGAS